MCGVARADDWSATIAKMGWIPSGFTSDDQAVLLREGPPGPQYREWERWEFKNPQTVFGHSYLSMVTLVEFDCAGRERVLAEIVYPLNNLGGENTDLQVTPNQPWTFVIPGSYDDFISTGTCHARSELAETLRSLKGKPKPGR